jgi:hypothetical protein
MTKVGVAAPVNKVQLHFFKASRDLCATNNLNELGKVKIELVEKGPVEGGDRRSIDPRMLRSIR